jgi:predicted dithiol-disulfide oxidoreductase (DUF899 family)
MADSKVVSDADWLEARRSLLAREKEFTRLRDELTSQRQELPWRKLNNAYRFLGPDGEESLGDLFAGKRQLVIYHFMFGPDWDEGCPSCSFWADNFNGVDIHLAHRDTTLLAVSNTALDKINAYKNRMGWTFKWVSSMGSDFNQDFHVTFTADEMAQEKMNYNYEKTNFPASEAPGISVFFKDESGEIFHTYSAYARGLDLINGAYNILDLTPIGRDEKGPDKHNMYWLCRRDQYDD